jgi:hypothetical protein
LAPFPGDVTSTATTEWSALARRASADDGMPSCSWLGTVADERRGLSDGCNVSVADGVGVLEFVGVVGPTPDDLRDVMFNDDDGGSAKGPAPNAGSGGGRTGSARLLLICAMAPIDEERTDSDDRTEAR